jgi:CheY-like chemotaxis protein
MFKVLVIDDQRIFKAVPNQPVNEVLDIVHETTSDKGFVTLVMDGPWDMVLLDHDLGMESSQSGYEMVMDVVDGIENHDAPLDIKQVYVHSMNPVGAERMVQALSRYFPVARLDPTPYLDFDAMYAEGRNPYLAGPRR